MKADDVGEPKPVVATLPPTGWLKAPPEGAGDPKLELPKAGVLAPPPKIDCAGAGEAGCPKADVPKPLPVEALPKIFPLLVLALPKADDPPNIEPPVAAAGLALTDPNSPPPELAPVEAPAPKILPVAGAGVALAAAAPNGLAVAPPPKIEPVLAAAGATGDVAGVIDPNRPVPAVGVVEAVAAVAPNGDPPPKIDDPPVAAEPAVTDPNRPVPWVAAGATLPKADTGLASVEPPKIDVVSDFGVEKAVDPKMLVEAGLDVSGGVDGEQILNEPNRFDVVSVVVDVGAGVVEV